MPDGSSLFRIWLYAWLTTLSKGSSILPSSSSIQSTFNVWGGGLEVLAFVLTTFRFDFEVFEVTESARPFLLVIKLFFEDTGYIKSLLNELPERDLYYLITSFGLLGLGAGLFDLYESGTAAAAVAAATAPPKLESTIGLEVGVMLKIFPSLLIPVCALVLNGLVTFLDAAVLLLFIEAIYDVCEILLPFDVSLFRVFEFFYCCFYWAVCNEETLLV